MAASNTAVSVAGDGGGASAAAVVTNNSPKSSSRGKVGSPWNQIVRSGVGVEEQQPVITTTVITGGGGGSLTAAAAAAAPGSGSGSGSPRIGMELRVNEGSDDYVLEAEGVDNGSGGNAAKKPAWNKPSNGVVEVNPVMGAELWPTLEDSTKASLKSSSSDPLIALSDAALPTLQIVGNSTSSSHKQVIPNNVNPSSAPNAGVPMRQKSMKRGGGSSSGSVNGGSSQLHSPQPQDSVGETPPTISGKPAAESSPRDHQHKSHGGNEQHPQRNPFRRGPHPRGDGSYHHNYGGKRDQDRGNHEWTPHNRGAGSRDAAHLQPQRGFPVGQFRPTPFIAQPMPGTIRPTFVNHMGYPDVPPHPLIYYPVPPPPDSLRAMPMVAPVSPHGMFFPFPDPQLHTKIVNQIDYYFSDDNLAKDTFLRKKMDDQGWVPIKLIAGFKKVTYLTENITLILEALRSSTVVEVQGDRVRRRNDWMKYLMPPVQIPNVAIPQPTGNSRPDMLASSLQGVALDENTSNQGHAESPAIGRSSSAESNSQLAHSGAEGLGQVNSQVGVERPHTHA